MTPILLALCILGAAAALTVVAVAGLMAYAGARYHHEMEQPQNFLADWPGLYLAGGTEFSTAQPPVEAGARENPGAIGDFFQAPGIAEVRT